MTADQIVAPNQSTDDQVLDALVFTRIKTVLEQCFNLEPEDIHLGSRIVADLGAESIDFLDLTFRLEREFGIRVPQGELFPSGVFEGDYEKYIKNGKITAAGIDKLQAAAPHVELRRPDGTLTFDGTIAGVQDAFTVHTLVRYVSAKIKGQQ